jgi:hypothetical protein
VKLTFYEIQEDKNNQHPGFVFECLEWKFPIFKSVCFFFRKIMFYEHEGPVIIYGRGGGRRESIMQPEKIITPHFSLRPPALP